MKVKFRTKSFNHFQFCAYPCSETWYYYLKNSVLKVSQNAPNCTNKTKIPEGACPTPLYMDFASKTLELTVLGVAPDRRAFVAPQSLGLFTARYFQLKNLAQNGLSVKKLFGLSTHVIAIR